MIKSKQNKEWKGCEVLCFCTERKRFLGSGNMNRFLTDTNNLWKVRWDAKEFVVTVLLPGPFL